MLDLTYISGFFPPHLQNNPAFLKPILKEYLQLMILDFISTSSFSSKLSFIGGTSLRLIHHIDRFSEDLDFDCKEMSGTDFRQMTDKVLQFLQRNGISVESKDKESGKLTAYRRNIYFPQLLFNLHLSGHKEERFLIKVEAQDQQITYKSKVINLKGCGFFFPVQTPPDDVLCAMKISALISRQKGRDFYDTMFLLSKTEPNYPFLQQKCGIGNKAALKKNLLSQLQTVDLTIKMHDFEHLLFDKDNSRKILKFNEFIQEL